MYQLRYSDVALNIAAVQRFAFDPSLLAVVQRHLGCAPVLAKADLWWRTKAVHNGREKPPGTVRDFVPWHQDWNFLQTVKVFMYLTDVPSKAQGPYRYVPGSHKVPQPPVRDQGEFLPAPESDDQVRYVLGSKGTVFLADSHLVHAATPMESGVRALLQLEYTMSLFGGHDGGLIVPLARVPPPLLHIRENWARVFARMEAGLMSLDYFMPTAEDAAESERAR